MKSFSKLVVVVGLIGLAAAFSGCTKLSGCMQGKKAVTVEDVGKTLANVLCEKYASCQQNPDFKKDECIQQISTGLSERLKEKTDFKVEQAMLDTCSKSIASAGCEVLSSETPPTGCEFLQ
jgi:hypothetical protein